MRVASNDPSLVNSFHAARAEAEAAFNDGTVYLERFVENPRHVEIQILGDKEGFKAEIGTPMADFDKELRHEVYDLLLDHDPDFKDELFKIIDALDEPEDVE